MGLTLAALKALEALCSARGRPVTSTVGVPFNERVMRALRRLRGDTERSYPMAAWNNEVLRLLGGAGSTVTEPSVRGLVSKTADYVITTADIEAGSTVRFIPAGASATATLPAVAGWTGRSVRIANAATVGSGKTVIVDGDGSETVGGDSTMTLNPGDAYTFESDGTRVLVY